jgi:hypothetical protein
MGVETDGVPTEHSSRNSSNGLRFSLSVLLFGGQIVSSTRLPGGAGNGLFY